MKEEIIVCESCNADYPENKVVGNIITHELFCTDCQEEFEKYHLD